MCDVAQGRSPNNCLLDRGPPVNLPDRCFSFASLSLVPTISRFYLRDYFAVAPRCILMKRFYSMTTRENYAQVVSETSETRARVESDGTSSRVIERV